MQNKKINIYRTAEVLKYIVILKQSVPVIENLIQTSDTIPGF